MTDNNVVFFSVNGDRPIRLSDNVRRLAFRGINGEFGQSMTTLDTDLVDIANVAGLTKYEKYAVAIEFIAKNAPLRYDSEEMLLGAATLSAAKLHEVPVYYNGKAVFTGSSHVTCGFDRMLKIGFSALEKEIYLRMEDPELNKEQRVFLNALMSCLNSFRHWHRRYIQLIQDKIENACCEERPIFQRVLENAQRVPENPPTCFREAVQSLWFMFSFLRLCGNWPGIGRIDLMLGEYLHKDLDEGKITLDEAREVLAQFWIKGCEWIDGKNTGGSGDAQYYQNIVLGGIDEYGNEVTNEVTFLVLDIVEELGISEFPVAVRINGNTKEQLFTKIAEVQRLGGGIVGVYNEELIIKSMVDFGYSLEEARRFANDGCWEVQVPGKTCFAYNPVDVLRVLQGDVLKLHTSEEADNFETFEALYKKFQEMLKVRLNEVQRNIDSFALGGYRHPGENSPAPLISLFTGGCIEKARDYYDRGAVYTVMSPHAGGIPDTANSLLAIKRLVFEERKIGLPRLITILRNNWEGEENLRRYSAQMVDYFGNDSEESNQMTKRVYDDFLTIIAEVPERNGILRPPGISTFGRQIEWRWERGATADGHFHGEILSGNLSPAPGTDKKGATAIIRSHCLLDLSRLTNGTALDIKLLQDTVRGPRGLAVLIALMKGFISLGGFFMQTDIIDNAILLEAQKNPEKYQHLAVRVSGWSARFVTLSREWQEMIINRTAQGE